MKGPSIQVPPPGPNAKKIIERDTRYLITSTKTAPVVAARAEGVYVEDVDGNVFLDLTSGIGVTNTGHGNPRVVKAVQEQAAKFIHYAGTDFYYDQQVTLAERLSELVPGDFEKKTFFTNSGTESNEAALKLCRFHTGRGQFLAFHGGFHGRTMGSLSFTASKPTQRARFFPTMPGVHHAHYANPYRNIWGIDGYAEPDELVNRCIDYIEDILFQTTLPAGDVAGLFVEPVQGEGGYIVPPKGFFPALRKLCDRHGILLVADEVQTGFGRTGKMFGMEHWGVAADITSLAKGIASGVPMGATVARADLDFTYMGAHSNTYGGNPVAAAAALATIDALTLDGLVENAARQGPHLMAGLRELQNKHPERVGDVRGLGLMVAIDFVKDPRTKEYDTKLRDRVVEEALKRGLVLLPCGKSAIRFIPPLIITREEIDTTLRLFGEATAAAL